MEGLISGSVQDLTISPIRISLDLLLVFVITRAISWHYEKYSLSNSFSNTKYSFTIVGLSTVLIISVVKSSLALSLGLVGALSIVRFRTPIKDPEELGYLFLVIASGLAAGAEQEVALIVSTPLILFFLYLIKDKKNSIGESGVICVETNKESYEKIIYLLQESNIDFVLSRLVKNKELYSLDILANEIDIIEFNKLIVDIENLGVDKLTFISNE